MCLCCRRHVLDKIQYGSLLHILLFLLKHDVILVQCPEYFLLIIISAGIFIIAISGILYTIWCANCCQIPALETTRTNYTVSRRGSVKQGHGFYATQSDPTAIVMDDGFTAHQNISSPPILSQFEAAVVQDETSEDTGNGLGIGSSEDYFNNAYTGIVHVPCGSCGHYVNSALTISESIDSSSDYNFAMAADADADALMF